MIFVTTIFSIVFFLSGYQIKLNSTNATGYMITENQGINGFDLEFNVNELIIENCITEKGEFIKVSFEGSIPGKAQGAPSLPSFRKLIALPFGAEPEVEVISYTTEEIRLTDLGISKYIFPVQPGYSKSSLQEERKFIYNEEEYLSLCKDDGINTASVTKNGTMRGVGVGSLVVRPVSYDPAERIIKIKNNLKLRITNVNSDSRAEEFAVSEYLNNSS